MAVYRFEPFSYQPSRSALTLDGERVEMRQKTARLLECFLEHPDTLLSKEDLLREVWDDVTVGEAVVFQTLSELRKLLARECPDTVFIQTVKGQGYRWVYPEPVLRLGPLDGESVATKRPKGEGGRGWRLQGRPAGWAAVGVLLLFALVWVTLGHFEPRRSSADDQNPRLLLLVDPFSGDGAAPDPASRGLVKMAERVLDSTGRLEVVTMGDEEQWFLDVARSREDPAGAAAHFGDFLGVPYVVFTRRLDPEGKGEGELHLSVYRGRERLAAESVDGLTLLEAAEHLGKRVADVLGLETPVRQVAGSFSNRPRALDAFALGEAARQRGETRLAAELFEKAVELDPAFLWAQASLARAYDTLGEAERADALVRKVLLGARTSQDYYLQVESLGLLASQAIRAGDWDALLDYQRQIQDAAWRWGNRRLEASALRMEGNYHRSLQNLDAAQASYEASLQVATAAGDLLAAAHAHNNLGTVALSRGDHAAAREALTRALDGYRQTGRRGFLAGPLANLGLVERELGRPVEARDYLERALEAARESDRPAFTARILSSLGMLSAAEGDSAEAQARLEEALELLARIQDDEGRATAAFNLAQVYLENDQAGKVPPLLGLCEAHWGDRQPHVQVLWAQYHHQRGERVSAVRRMERAKELYGDGWDDELEALLASYR